MLQTSRIQNKFNMVCAISVKPKQITFPNPIIIHSALCIVSHYNNIRSSHRLAMSLDTVNDRLAISLNGVGTAQFDPRPYVAEFLTDKERREGNPHPDIYANRFYTDKFFREGGEL